MFNEIFCERTVNNIYLIQRIIRIISTMRQGTASDKKSVYDGTGNIESHHCPNT